MGQDGSVGTHIPDSIFLLILFFMANEFLKLLLNIVVEHGAGFGSMLHIHGEYWQDICLQSKM